jgi:7-cyano-7-deazaguanine synthase in queuosine biosynthesis
MTLHAIVGRLGVDDASAARIPKGYTATDVQFVPGANKLDFGLSQILDHLARLGFIASEIGIDLAVLAALVTAADTRVSRQSSAIDAWTRQLAISVPVSDPALWSKQTVLLQHMLNFLTGDRWTVMFRARPQDQASLRPKTARLAVQVPDCVCLFSGGLDSFIGAVDLLSAGKQPLLISHYWDGITSDAQNESGRILSKEYGKPVLHVRARVGFEKVKVKTGENENSLRGRSFMFFALAALAASSLSKPSTIYVPENGLISLNVPLDPLRLGSLSTRTTHPFCMARWNELMAGLGIPAVLHNPYRHMTKGEMVASCANGAFLKKAASTTMSCAAPAKIRWLGDTPKHCGHCVPCLIRRAALIRGFGADDTDYYLADLKSKSLNSRKAEGEHVRAFQRAISRLKKKPQSARFLIHQPGPLTDHPTDWGKYQAVYVNGMSEVDAILAGVVTKPS